MNYIGFPNIGIQPFRINNTAFSIGFLQVRWYGVIIVVGMILGCLYAYYRMKSLGIKADDILDVIIICIPSGIIGARVFYVLTTLNEIEYKSFYDVIAIWEGGLAIYGCIIAGLIAMIIVCKVKKISVLALLDCASPAVMIGQIIGRWGNFMNAEAYGVVGQYDFLGKSIDLTSLAYGNPLLMTINGEMVHPTFLYESVWNLIGFLIINAFWKKRKYNGNVFLWYITWYGLGRCIIEGLRGDSLYIGNIRISQAIGLACFVVGLILLIVLAFRHKGAKKVEEK
jgi:phosphatidylglycerol:prolipoprotein diacylglycerol transferase